MQNLLHSVGEFLTPTLKKSNFTETGRLTPEEFVAAGDYLVFKCPTWSWSAGDASRSRSFLPPNKQVLVTRNVPSLAGLKKVEEKEDVAADGDFFSWISMVSEKGDEGENEEVLDIDEVSDDGKGGLGESNPPLTSVPASHSDEEIPDLEDFQIEDNVVIVNDPVLKQPKAGGKVNDNIMRTRTFDLSITYDKYYQTPRVWVSGYSATGTPLPPASLFDSISTEHARKTVTIETHPAFGIPMASIHPCKHAHVMKRIVRFMSEEKGLQGAAPGSAVVRVDQYLVVFLKFISTVLPHIDYDHTMSLDA